MKVMSGLSWRRCKHFLIFVASSSLASHAWATPFVNEFIDRVPFGSRASLIVSSNGTPHIVYQSEGTLDLKHAFKVGGAWTIETIDATGSVGDDASIATDGTGAFHVAYQDATNLDLKYATNSSGVWATEPVDQAGNVGAYTSIVVDPSGNPHISYTDQTNGDLKYAANSGGVWSIETVDAAGSTGFTTSLALDAQSSPRIAYWDQTNGDLRYASKSGATWFLTTVDPGGDVGAEPSLRLDVQGNPRVSYKDIGLGDLKYASRSGVTWTLETVDASGNVGNHTSLWLDPQGNPRISYLDVTNGDLKYAIKSGGSWATEVVDMAGTVGYGTSLGVDYQGNSKIAHVTLGSSPYFLKYADSGVRVTGPMAGVTWPVGALRDVNWTGVGPVSLSLSSDGGETYQVLLDGIVTSPVAIRVPHSPTRFARIKIERLSPLSTAISESLFTIQTSISLLTFAASLAPGGGADLSWTTDPGVNDLAGYRIERSDGWAPENLIRTNSFHDPRGASGHRYRLFAINGLGEELLLGEASVLPERLLSAWPLPYRGGQLHVSLAVGGLVGAPGLADVALYDVNGRLVRQMARGSYPQGYQTMTWDGRDRDGARVANGIYFLRSESAGQDHRLKVVVMQ